MGFSYTFQVALGDLDGDGDQDIVLTHTGTSNGSRIYWNDGTGRVTADASDLGDRTLNANALSIFDAEGDGDLDVGVYYATNIRHSRLYVNQGDGSFAPGEIEIPGLCTWGDIDGDGDADAVTLLHDTNGGYGFKVLLNDGSNGFSELQHLQQGVPFMPGAAALGDVDGDGDLDLIAGGGTTIEGPVTAFLNNGVGEFQLVPDSHFGMQAGRISLGDVNGDGLVDVLLGCLTAPLQLGLSNGDGTFTDAGIPLGASESIGLSAIGDLNGDGYGDLVLSAYGRTGPKDVWINVTVALP